ncbi:MAG: Gfo/Idh/MocA family oxidoreductase [Planctomycetota bacterium]|nr:Gfo/Idh/MocA family oxidoreductase [Planctomycetota bacterium]
MTIHVAFIGAGEMANAVHYPSVARMPNVKMTAVCDLDAARAVATADRYGIPGRYSDYRQMFECEKVDAVYVIMSPRFVRPIVMDCLAAGKHVFTEKPLGMSAAEAREMAGRAAEMKRVTAVGFNRRFSPVLAEAHRRVAARGPLTTVLAEFHKDMKENYEQNKISIVRSDMIHVLDVLAWAGGEVAAVQSCSDRLNGEDWINSAHALLRFRGGCVGLFSANRKNGNRYERFEFHGNGISAYVRAPETAEIYETGRKEPEILRGAELCGTDEFRVTYGYEAETRHFLACVAEGRACANSFEAAVGSYELAERIEQGSM